MELRAHLFGVDMPFDVVKKDALLGQLTEIVKQNLQNGMPPRQGLISYPTVFQQIRLSS